MARVTLAQGYPHHRRRFDRRDPSPSATNQLTISLPEYGSVAAMRVRGRDVMTRFRSNRGAIIALVVHVAIRAELVAIIIVLFLVWLIFTISSVVIRGLFRLFSV
jgi:hypothetical protein